MARFKIISKVFFNIHFYIFIIFKIQCFKLRLLIKVKNKIFEIFLEELTYISGDIRLYTVNLKRIFNFNLNDQNTKRIPTVMALQKGGAGAGKKGANF